MLEGRRVRGRKRSPTEQPGDEGCDGEGVGDRQEERGQRRVPLRVWICVTPAVFIALGSLADGVIGE